MTAPVRCPHCGELLVGLPEENPAPNEVRALIQQMTRSATIESRVLRILADHFDEFVLTSSLIEEIYGQGGGPLRARETMHVRAYDLRRRLAPLGLTIKGRNQPPGASGYRLCFAP